MVECIGGAISVPESAAAVLEWTKARLGRLKVRSRY
jgi:hypothetical protein